MTATELPPAHDGTAGPRRKTISYALPVYNEQAGIRLFHRRLAEVIAARPEYEYELLYVNDGSTDDSLKILRELAAADRRIRVIDFARNYGHQVAITAGLDQAIGDAVIVMDTDLQDPPEVSIELVDAWVAGADVVYAQRRTRRDTAFKRITAHSYYRVLQTFADVRIPRDTGDFRLMSRRVVDELCRYRERNRFIRGIVASMGFTQVAVQFDRDERAAGETHYSLPRMLRLAADGVTSFSTVPLKMIARLGFLTVALALLGIVYALVLRIFFPQISVPGWTLLMIVVLFMGGIQMLSLGVMGAYVGRIYQEVQNRPLYHVKQMINQEVRELIDDD